MFRVDVQHTVPRLEVALPSNQLHAALGSDVDLLTFNFLISVFLLYSISITINVEKFDHRLFITSAVLFSIYFSLFS